MRKNIAYKLVALSMLTSIMLTGCKQEAPVRRDIPVQTVDYSNYEIEADVDLDLKSNINTSALLLDTMYNNKKGNMLISPLSINLALGMVEAGADGTTKDALDKFFEGTDYSKVARYYADKGYNFMEIANAIWVDEKYKLYDEYNNVVKYYDAKVENLDFSKAGRVANTINDWVNDKTHHLIKEIIDKDDITKDTMTVITNCLYFKSKWSDEWHEYKFDFNDFNGKVTNVKGISGTADKYYETDKARGFAAEYRDGFYFVGILPNEEGEFNLADLDIASFLNSEVKEYDKIYVKMPKLDYETTYILDELKDAGLGELFTDNSNVPYIIEGCNLEIEKVIHKCTIKLDENGTEASAATAIMMKNDAAAFVSNYVNIVLDRPYAYLIYDSNTNQVLFMGKVIDL